MFGTAEIVSRQNFGCSRKARFARFWPRASKGHGFRRLLKNSGERSWRIAQEWLQAVHRTHEFAIYKTMVR